MWTSRAGTAVTFFALLCAGTAEARFGKGGSGEDSTHAAVPVDSPSSSSSSSSDSSDSRDSRAPPRRRGFFSGAFVPFFGYGFRPSPAVVLLDPDEASEGATRLRATAGAEFIYFANQKRGYALGLGAGFEGERFGVSLSGQHLSVATDDGTPGDDTLQQLSARLSYAFLVGSRGRLRAELGADMVFAPDVVLAGPSFGLSGTVWLGGPLAIEASAMGTVFPFWQFDGRAGLVIGAGPLGFRLGWRIQLLDDQGVVDGVAHRDVFTGPYAGLGFAL